MALYEMSVINVSVSSGPSWGLMALSKNTNFLITHIIDESYRNSTCSFLEEVQGLKRGEQYPFHSKFQRVCWGEEDDAVINEFNSLFAEINRV